MGNSNNSKSTRHSPSSQVSCIVHETHTQCMHIVISIMLYSSHTHMDTQLSPITFDRPFRSAYISPGNMLLTKSIFLPLVLLGTKLTKTCMFVILRPAVERQ